MDVDDDSTRLFDFTLKDVKLEVSYRCINNSIAYNVSDDFIVFYIVSDTLFNKHSKGTDGPNIMAYGSKGVVDRLNITLPTGDNPVNPVYVYFKATYYNKQIKGIKQPILRRLYQINIKPHPKVIEDVAISSVFSQKDYATAKRLLIKNKIW